MERMAVILALGSLVVMVSSSAWADRGDDDPKISVAEMSADAEARLEGMRNMRDSAEAAVRKARSDKDWARMECINEALIALKGVLKLAEDYKYDLQSYSAQGDDKAVSREHHRIVLAGKKLATLDGQWKACGSPTEEGIVEGEPVIQKKLSPDLPNQDPLSGLETDDTFVSRPSVNSPY